jgi:D-alanyl-lipoteichoic acid acyltransferase DltB (MBOAT superfamily)
MLFNSYSFLLFFLPLTLSAYHSLPGPRSRLALLVFSSWLFYAWWSLSLSTMVLAFCAVNFWVGGIIHRSSSPGRRRAWIVSLVGLDLGVLAFFKYHPLLAQSLAMVHVSVPEMDIVLPIGISFYTFQGVSYAPRTRMVNLVARIERPYESATQNGGQPGRPPLAVGMFVEARITGRTYNQVFAVPRQALRGNDTVLVVDANDRVQARAVKLLRSEGERVLVREGLASGERLCLSLLEGFTEGMAVRTVESEATPAGQR